MAVCLPHRRARGGRGRNPEEILLLESQRLRRGPGVGRGSKQRAGGATLALCPADEAGALSLAASWGCDDMLAAPLDPIELVRRLQTLASLTLWSASASAAPSCSRLIATGPKPRRQVSVVQHIGPPCLLGRPGPEQVQLACVMSAAL